jgi:hypothetical protein
MSKNIANIYDKIMESNKELYYRPSALMKEISLIKQNIKHLEKKIEELYAICTNNR